ncbi:hypothetical protein LMORI2_05400 [Limnohabitans sp. MORI2]|jgi:hypothetical protein|uniref:hypothetical protein n=1 Tax=Limnohabitans sp. MORI2 TaxID=1751150 RepID=UPI0023776BD7|nr:hypothetical protein [Limnohabitans sp. MORI2]BDU57558.1 hypothetical protein LMORI2_05400 [Limnohabitans sp. MORI2]
MSSEPQFLSFKGLKQYTPEDGWGQVNAILQSHAQQAVAPMQAPQPVQQRTAAAAQPAPQAHYPQQPAVPDNIPTLTETPDTSQPDTSAVFDPLIDELFEQLRVPPSDDLTQTWRTIAAEVNLLTERMALQRELQERLQKLDQELLSLRGTILSHLTDVQQAADQQLTSARLRAEVSALAQTKLSAKLKAKL